MHINIHSLPAKIDQLNILLLRLKQKNINLRKTKSRGGVALYIRNDMKYKRRTDIELNVEGEFESIFAEITGNPKSTIIGQIYRVLIQMKLNP